MLARPGSACENILGRTRETIIVRPRMYEMLQPPFDIINCMEVVQLLGVASILIRCLCSYNSKNMCLKPCTKLGASLFASSAYLAVKKIQ